MDFITIIGVAASIFTAGALLPQLIKLVKEKKGNDLSMMMLAVLFTGLALWTSYGVLKKDLIIIVSNSFSMVLNAAIAILTWRYKHVKNKPT